jgi:hypothetical protein
LRFEDITADGLLIRRTKFQKSRLVPSTQPLSQGLNDTFNVASEPQRPTTTFSYPYERRLSRNAV